MTSIHVTFRHDFQEGVILVLFIFLYLSISLVFSKFSLFCLFESSNSNLQTKWTYKHSLHSVLRKKLPAFMARSATKAAGESDVTAAGEETLDFDDVTLRGEKKHVTVNSL